jgi:hypothetical protein
LNGVRSGCGCLASGLVAQNVVAAGRFCHDRGEIDVNRREYTFLFDKSR